MSIFSETLMLRVSQEAHNALHSAHVAHYHRGSDHRILEICVKVSFDHALAKQVFIYDRDYPLWRKTINVPIVYNNRPVSLKGDGEPPYAAIPVSTLDWVREQIRLQRTVEISLDPLLLALIAGKEAIKQAWIEKNATTCTLTG